MIFAGYPKRLQAPIPPWVNAVFLFLFGENIVDSRGSEQRAEELGL